MEKSILKSKYTETLPTVGMVTYTIYDNGIAVYSGRAYSDDDGLDIDFWALYLKDRFNHQMNEIINLFNKDGFRFINIQEPTLEVQYTDDNGSNIYYPTFVYSEEETPYLSIKHKTLNQPVLLCKNIENDGYLQYVVNGQIINTNKEVKRGHLIVITNLQYLTDLINDVVLNLDIMVDNDTYECAEFIEDECTDNMFIVDQHNIYYYDIECGQLTRQNRKNTFMNKLKNDIIYNVDVTYSIPVTINSDYNDALLELLNNNYGVITAINGDVNYGHIDESSIVAENYKQSFKVKI